MKNYDLSEEERDIMKNDIFTIVRNFELKYIDLSQKKPHLWSPVSKAALQNYALGLLNHEYYKLGKEDRDLVLKQYE